MFPWRELPCERFRALTNVQNMHLVLKWAEQEVKTSTRREPHHLRLWTKDDIALPVRTTEQLEEAVLLEVILVVVRPNLRCMPGCKTGFLSETEPLLLRPKKMDLVHK